MQRNAVQKGTAGLEAQLLRRLPEDYRKYLLTTSGHDLEHRFFRSIHSGDELWELAELYSIGENDIVASILQKLEPTNFYDVVSFSDKVTNFIVIGEEDTGGALLINLVDGTLWLLAHDYPAADKSLRVGENSSFFQLRVISISSEEYCCRRRKVEI